MPVLNPALSVGEELVELEEAMEMVSVAAEGAGLPAPVAKMLTVDDVVNALCTGPALEAAVDSLLGIGFYTETIQ